MIWKLGDSIAGIILEGQYWHKRISKEIKKEKLGRRNNQQRISRSFPRTKELECWDWESPSKQWDGARAHTEAHHCVFLKHLGRKRSYFRLPEIKKKTQSPPEKSHIRGNWMFAEFSIALLGTRGHWSTSFKILKQNYFQPRILYPSKLYGGWRFSDQHNLNFLFFTWWCMKLGRGTQQQEVAVLFIDTNITIN